MFQNPPDQEICALLKRSRRIAVVGLSPAPARPSYRVSHQMQAWGFEIVPVRPLVESVLGQTAYARLEDVPGKVDIVNVFRNAAEVDGVVDSAIAIGAPAIWIQQGIINHGAALRAQAAGLFVVMYRCIMVDYAAMV
ncbi:CoA-binding protein [Chitinimonas sp. BJB300]|uniref:CoA-binding protein n=1 Tax=Chitinimonas sp. BJB300 TaxID=1559339 RepID=UPI000C0CCF88|nr:CoA-binding protein [Chitinimonas sp. BJB300]PHV12368.1 CoA-binding protein [Chitinimonas sp. BJB300]TSJ91077.1 CoA-binding protein [Chitinimonas sp. BJB300]